jgi:hypothetical protein
MAKPFSIQSPEDIAKEYAGNKQKIAQAMQMGIVDPTAGVLAGMFIDRMRSAQMQEQVPQTTVAQQVMGGLPPAQPAPPLPAGGLGATSPVLPPMTPPMDMAAPMPQETPMGMADGGLAMLSVPDAMFDEPTNGGFNDGYAGGGIVAFSDGGDVPSFSGGGSTLDWLRAPVTSPYGVKRSTGSHQGKDYGVRGGTPIGSPAPGFVVTASYDNINGNFVIVEHPDGSRSSYSHLSALKVKPGQQVGRGDILGLSGNTGRVRGRNGGYHLHFGARDAKGNRINPDEFFERILPQMSSGKSRSTPPERDVGTAAGRSQSFDDIYQMFQSQYGPTEEEKAVRAKRMARAKEMASDEYYEEQRKASMWETLAEIGFNMASSKSPFLLQAVGEAAAAALPGAKVARKEREALTDRALDAMEAVNGLKRKENRELLGLTFDAYKTGLSQEQFDRELGFRREELKSRETQAALDRALNREIEKARAARAPMSDLETMVAIQESGTPEQKAALVETLRLKQQYGTGGVNPLTVLPPGPGGTQGGQGTHLGTIK